MRTTASQRPSWPRRFWQDERGVTAVEFSIVFFPFLLMVFGIFEFGRAFYVQSSLDDVANQTVRQIYIAQIDPTETLATLETEMTTFARSVMTAGNPALLNVTVASGPGAQSRTLTVNYTFNFTFNLTGQMQLVLHASRAFVGS